MIGTITAQLKLTVNIPADMRWTSPGGLSSGGSASVTTNVTDERKSDERSPGDDPQSVAEHDADHAEQGGRPEHQIRPYAVLQAVGGDQQQ